jgi:hypothetical protein
MFVQDRPRPDADRAGIDGWVHGITGDHPAGANMEKDPTDGLMQVLNDKAAALIRGDGAFFERMLDEDFRYINAGGKVFNKPAYLDYFIISGEIQWQAQELDDVNIRRYGDVAVVTCRISDRAALQGDEFSGAFRSTQVFVRHPEGWRYVSGQTTAMAKEQ